MKKKMKKKIVKPIISVAGSQFIHEVDSEGSPSFKAHPKDYIGLGLFESVSVESTETLVLHQEFDMNTGTWYVWLELKDKNGKTKEITEKVELR